MPLGFIQNNVDVANTFVTKDWVIANYSELLSVGFINVPNRRLYLAGSGFTGLSPYASVAPGVVEHAVVGSLPWRYISNRYLTRIDNTLWTWGDNTNGTLGDSTTIHRSSPVQIGSSWRQISSQNTLVYPSHPVGAIADDGSLYVWGNNGSGELGQNNTIHRSSPVQVGTRKWLRVATGASSMVAIGSDGTLWSWGSNSNGELGANISSTLSRSSPVQINSDMWSMISGGGHATFIGVKADGTLWSWGRNDMGQVGDNTTINRSSPVQITSATNWRYAAVGVSFCCAINTNNELYVWGSNSDGNLGLGDTVHRSSPTQLGSSIWSISCYGRAAGFALAVDGTLWGWGSGTQYISGPATSSPVQISLPTSRKPIHIGAYEYMLYALTEGGAFE
jgi:alpha-tubulin suppressor-like RCC1 family protein